ncbi:MAG: MMPL family transporter [Deltaproteobacteria bacterium]|nr:MMPL family transporter [Deltaproteobacteria bacterium]
MKDYIMNGLIRQTTLHPVRTIILILLLTVPAALLLVQPGVKRDPNPYPLNRDHPSMISYRKLQNEFTGNKETALVMLVHPETVFNPDTLIRIQRLSSSLESMNFLTAADKQALAPFRDASDRETAELLEALMGGEGSELDELTLLDLRSRLETEPVQGLDRAALEAVLEDLLLRRYPVRKLTSLSTVENVMAEGDSLRVGRYYEEVPRGPEELEALRRLVSSDEILRDVFISKDGRATTIIVETNVPDHRTDLHLLMAREIERLAVEIPGPGKVHLSGTPVLNATNMLVMNQDSSTLFPVVMTLLTVLLWVTFRSLRGILLPLGVVLLSVVWTLALKVAGGVPLNMITASLPLFLITIGVADGIHLVSEFKHQLARLGDRRRAVAVTVEHMFMPVVMTSLTTAAGFASLAYTDLIMVRHFGMFVALGALVAMVITLVLVPAVLSLGANPAASKGPEPDAGGGGLVAALEQRMVGLLAGVSRLAVERPLPLVLVSIVIAAAAGYGVTRVQAENDFLTYFEESMPAIQATRAIDATMAGSLPANVLISATGVGSEPFKNPARLAAVEALQEHLKQVPHVGKTLSLVDMLKRINRTMHSDDPKWHRLPGDDQGPEGRNLIAQYLLLYENGGGENLNNFVTPQFDELNVVVNMSSRNTEDVERVISSIAEYAAAHFPPEMKIRFAGTAEMITASNNEIVSSQVRSLSISLLVIFLLLMLQFRSPTRALLGIIPLSFAVLMNFGFMGYFGFFLNAGTAIVSSIVIGVGVDFAIHFLSRLQTELDRGAGLAAAVTETMLSSGKAISANAFIVAAGFSVLTISRSVPMQTGGIMIAMTLLVSALATLVLLPAVISFCCSLPAPRQQASQAGGKVTLEA